MFTPTLSIGIPVFNGADSIEDTIKSILEQPFQDFEIIISDDCSTDNTEKICEDLASKDQRIKFFKQEKNFGMPVFNFKFVLEHANGRYFMFLAHDDRCSVKFINKMIELLDSDQMCCLAFSSYAIKDTNSEKKIKISPSSSCSKSNVSRYISRLIDMQPALIYGMFRRSAFHSDMLRAFDFFEVHLGLQMALVGNIRIANEELFSWNIKSKRKSYTIFSFGNYMRSLVGIRQNRQNNNSSRANYLPFYFAQTKLIFKTFGLLKGAFIFFVLSYFVIAKIILVLFKPKSSDLDFKKI